MKQYINIPAKVIASTVENIVGAEFWPYDNGNDPYWKFGSSPKFYRWNLTINVTPQVHSAPMTREPFRFNAMDVGIGDYIADIVNGVAVKIISISNKTTTTLECVVEDVFRYNTFRDPAGTGIGIFSPGAETVIFELNESSMPVVDPATVSGLSGSFYNNLASRFQNLEAEFNFILEKENHGFELGDLIAADSENNTFVKAAPEFPYLIGTVSDVDLGPHAFTVNPFTKVVDNFNYLDGGVGSIIYSDVDEPGGYSLSGVQPVMIKLRNQTNTSVVGTVVSPTTTPGGEFKLNGQTVSITGAGDTDDFMSSVNFFTAQTGVTASEFAAPTVVEPDNSPVGFLQVPATATINGVTVNFSTYVSGQLAFGEPGYADMNDMAVDINAAAIPDLVTTVVTGTFGTSLRLTFSGAGPLDIVNIMSDGMGNPFAGPSSCSGLPLSTVASTNVYVALSATDARPISLYDTVGSPTTDFGLYSVENGSKAAALFIEQGIRQAATYVVSNIASRDALSALFGDQCFVQDTGNGEWGHYIYSLDSAWVQIANKDSSETDAQSVDFYLSANSDPTGVIHTISNGRRVSFVTVTVIDPFNAPAVVEVGDDSINARLMTVDQNDLTNVGDYSTTPSYTYSPGADTTIKYYFSPAGATQGNAIVAITYT